jgi:hypothetical protein
MFLDCAPAYFVYMSRVLFADRSSILVKVVGVHLVSGPPPPPSQHTLTAVGAHQIVTVSAKGQRITDQVRGTLTTLQH